MIREYARVGVALLSLVLLGGEGERSPGRFLQPVAMTKLARAEGPWPLLPERDEHLSGGQGTVFATSQQAFSLPLPGLSAEQETQFFVGNSFFNRNWVIAPSSTAARDGLGPLFNARSCSGCHLRDGRGQPPTTPDEPLVALLLRLSIPGPEPHHGVVPEPRYGDQLQGFAVPSVPPEGKVIITYDAIHGTFADGEAYSLRQPTYTLTDLGYGALHAETRLSPRVAPFIIGLGLLEAIPTETLLVLADPEDRDGDGISGRPNMVWDVVTQQPVLGRFGWKANQPSVAQQTASAFLGDIGITSALFPDENCTAIQAACHDAPHGGQPEVTPDILSSVVFYARTLAVPAQRQWDDPEVRRGKQLFLQARCAGCHTPTLRTERVPELPGLSHQVIHPYTDLLLHDMGAGLADGRSDFVATGQEWRTPPLWGIGLIHIVNGHTTFLHDGRARNLPEAILWHGGEAEAAREAFRTMSRADRAALIRFLESL
jgi:CxxC motif-containing protein (DUF1111 family)